MLESPKNPRQAITGYRSLRTGAWEWARLYIEDLDLDRTNLGAFYDLGCTIDPISKLPNQARLSAVAVKLLFAKFACDDLLKGAPVALRSDSAATFLLARGSRWQGW